MRKLLLVFVALALLLAISGPAQAQDKVEIFGGYSFLRSSVPITVSLLCPAPACVPTTTNQAGNLQGWEASGTFKPKGWFGVTADFAGQYGTISGANTHLTTFMAGPQVSFPGKVSPFARVLVGGARVGGSSALAQVLVPNSTSIAAAVGVGIDIKVFPALYVRPIQIEYMATRLNSVMQNHARVSAGVVLHF